MTAAGHVPPTENGHGLVGLRERVKIYAGSMDAGPDGGRGFVLRTRFPLTVDAR